MQDNFDTSLDQISHLNHRHHSSSSIRNQTDRNDLKSRQAEVMARGLPKRKPIVGVNHILLVASGKGGVGKSTSAVNIATALKAENPNKQVGLLDADVFGPSVPLMMNLDDSPLLDNGTMSMGFLVNKDAPVIWRGLMVMQALERLLRQVAWDPVDYLVVDTPPGTGDTHFIRQVSNLSLLLESSLADIDAANQRSIHVHFSVGVLLVTTPQTAALQVTQRGANMFRKLEIPIIGVLQNMSAVECPKCLNKVSLHSNSSETLIRDLGVSILGDIPIDSTISQGSDTGVPVVISHPNGAVATAYLEVAREIMKQLDKKS
ncbi:hypothetical protein FOCC_FOCC006155 [Frankliniella occidentalis]|nr:hypothetical protein FOCC_FOCC006155 [Frankliniella occidentalis]